MKIRMSGGLCYDERFEVFDVDVRSVDVVVSGEFYKGMVVGDDVAVSIEWQCGGGGALQYCLLFKHEFVGQR